jgi:hypothetical protein
MLIGCAPPATAGSERDTPAVDALVVIEPVSLEATPPPEPPASESSGDCFVHRPLISTVPGGQATSSHDIHRIAAGTTKSALNCDDRTKLDFNIEESPKLKTSRTCGNRDQNLFLFNWESSIQATHRRLKAPAASQQASAIACD